ncbi:uncharacterized protein LOC128962193 isoform X2 [Oppia nitens]|uniref:uncharacterized protein LOC128962193 isoform X2 n=1 Tax=Oppia nitens TaxID=1686743 RepID=UPI0023D9D72C|nr:uncharacterized protein LOC128962193 isoform X2 [Oppia nitens]
MMSNESNNEEPQDDGQQTDNTCESPPPLSSLSIKEPQKPLALHLRPTVTTSPATPCKEQPNKELQQLKSPLKSPKSPTSITAKASPLRSPPKLATLSKPLFLNRGARHSIDVKALPSYLAKKRQSTFGQFLSVLNQTARDNSSSSDEPIFEEPIAPTLSLGERVAWVKTSGPEFGSVRWIGRMPQVTNDWTVGVEFDNCIGSGDGTVDGRRYFVAKDSFAKFLPLSALTKVDNYAGRPRSGTMLSRMSVQLKPGQLISIQRSPSVVVQHCSLNAPHHVGHDVHTTNLKHCQCSSCNHPCAHLCQTSRPKGKPKWMDPGTAHMCHFSSKPHSKMCCGGEDLPSANKPLTYPGSSWLPQTDVTSLKTVPTETMARRKSVTIYDERNAVPVATSAERQPQESFPFLNYPLKERRGSDLSISSLPSSGSPQPYIARGVLTDESDYDSDTDRSYQTKFGGFATMADGFKSLVACFAQNPSSLREKKRIKDKRKRKHRKQRRRAKISYNSRHRRGLSSDGSYTEHETTHSHNQTPSYISNGSSPRMRTNASDAVAQHKSTCTSPKLFMAHNGDDCKEFKEKESKDMNERHPDKDRQTAGVIIEEELSNSNEMRRHRVDDDVISEGNEDPSLRNPISATVSHRADVRKQRHRHRHRRPQQAVRVQHR